MSNCFLKLKSSGTLSIVVSDPHLSMMFNEPKNDFAAIANMIHTLIVGRPPICIPGKTTRQMHQAVMGTVYHPMILYYYDLAD